MWWLRIIALNAVAGVEELLYAVEGAYFIPAIYDKGLSLTYGSMLLCVSPILGVLFQSYLGSASDQCKSRWGRRRPFIFALAIAGMAGLILFPFTENIADLLEDGDLEDARYSVLLILTLLATTLTDFSVGALMVPGRAYLLDVLPEEYTKFGNIICSVWISSGATIGFAIGVIPWSSNFQAQVKIVCGIALVIIIIWIAMTLLSVDENNPQLGIPAKIEPGQTSAVVNEDNITTIQEPTTQYQANAVNTCKLEDNKSISSLSIPEPSQTSTVVNEDDTKTIQPTTTHQANPVNTYDLVDDEKIPLLSEGDQSQGTHNSVHDNNVADEDSDDQRCGICGSRCCNNLITSILGNIHFISRMSVSMITLCFAMFFGGLAVYTQMFFFTDFVADVIYDGDVTAPEDSEEYDDYTDGVEVGSLALGISAVSSLVFSFIAGPLMRLCGMRFVLVSSYVVSMVQTGIIFFCHNLVVIFVLLPALYCLVTIMLLIPFILVAEYDARSILLRKPWPFEDTNLIGRACSALTISMLFGELVALLINGPLNSLYGGAETVMIISCIASFVGAVLACFVIVPKEPEKNTEVADKHKTVAEATESTGLLIN